MKWRRAIGADREALDELTLAGLRHWGHHEHHPEAYQALAGRLQTEDSPEMHPVWVIEDADGIAGFYELRVRDGHVELLRMFQRPQLIGQGIGRRLWNHAVCEAQSVADRMMIVSDPGAVGFYEAMGAAPGDTFQPFPGFVLTVFWFDLTRG